MSWKMLPLKRVLLLFLSFSFIFVFIHETQSHIVGPEIVEPSSSGWYLMESDKDVSSSVINDLERASSIFPNPGYGIFFAGKKEYVNGTSFGWFGAMTLDGKVLWEKKISTSYFTTAVSAQYNKTDSIYVSGYGPQGCTLFKVNFTGYIYWNTTFGDPGDIINQMAIVKIDGGFTASNNGVNIVGTKSDGKHAAVWNFNETTGTLNFTYSPGNDNASEWDEALAVAIDPAISFRNIIYIGGIVAYSNEKPDDYHAFIEQLNLTTMQPNWRRVLNFTRNLSITAIQVEPTYGGIITIGNIGDDIMIYPLFYTNGEDGWNMLPKPYFKWGGNAIERVSDVIILGERTNYMIYACGWTSSYGKGGEDFFTIKVDFAAKLRWEKTWGAMKNERANSLTAEPGMAVFIGGVSGKGYAIVQNPSGTISPIVKFFGSNENVLMFLVIFIIIIPASLIVAIVLVNKNIKKKKLSSWIESKKNEIEKKEDYNHESKN
ncbi:MAG: hypothetical protein ACTSVI_01035 [Promethearchaeota archaeon]